MKKLNARNIIFSLLFIGFITYVFFHLKELSEVVDAFSRGSWRWLLVAALLQAVYYVVYSFMTKKAFEAVKMYRKLKHLIPLVLGSLFVNTLAPTAGNSGTILFADDAARRKESSTHAVVGYLVSTVSSYASFTVLLIFAVYFLSRNNFLNTYEIIGATIFVIPTALPPLLLFTAAKNPLGTTKFLNGIAKVVNFFLKIFRSKRKLLKKWGESITEELREAASMISGHYLKIAETLGYALIAHIINILSLFVIFVAFDIKIHYGALVAGYVFAEVARVISPQPEGVGAVEAVIVLIFTSFGVPLVSATAIAIAFRGLNFWLPLGLGFFYLQKLESFKQNT